MNVNINGKGSHIVKQHNVNKERAYIEIERLLGSSANDDGDEVAQFQADRFIADQFCMVWPKKKRPKEVIKGLAEAVALQERMGFKSCFSPQKMDNNHDKQEAGTIDDAKRRMLDMLQSRAPNEPSSQSVDSTEVKTKELDSLLKESFEAYRLGHYSLAATKYKMAWEMITDATLKLRVEHTNEDVVCYMLSLSLLETGQLDNLLEAVELLVALEKRSSLTFPAVYYALSKAHHKHYRFGLALKAIDEGFALLKGDIEMTKYTIPGSDITLEESTKDGLSVSLAAMKDECSKWHPPDAVCCMGECLPSSRLYGPNRDIYFSDPAFNGMIVLTCSNARNPCSMKFHQACWKSKKDQLSALKKLSDKDIIGHECFTPNCEDGQGNHSVITWVEVYGEDGKLKTHIEAPANPVVWGKRRPLPKGAIPKQQVKPKRHSEKIRRPVATPVTRPSLKEAMEENRAERAWRLAKLAKLRQNNFGVESGCEWRPDVKMYGNPQMMEIGDFLGGPIFENDSHQMVAIKTFIFTYFHEFIKENGCVKKKEITQKWEDDKFIFDNYSDVLHSETDICDFLLQSYKLVSIGDYIGIAENLPELYAVVRNEVCGCLKILLADPFHSRAVTMHDDDLNVMTSDCDERKDKPTSVVADSDTMTDVTARLDKIQQVNTTSPVTAAMPSHPWPGNLCEAAKGHDSLSKTTVTNYQVTNENIDFHPDSRLQNDIFTSMPQNLSTCAAPKSSYNPTDLEENVDRLFICDQRLEGNDSAKLEQIHDPNHDKERPQCNTSDGKTETAPSSSQAGFQLHLNGQESENAVEMDVNSKEGLSHGVYRQLRESALTDALEESLPNQDSRIYSSAFGDRKLESVINYTAELNRETQETESRFDLTARGLKRFSINNDDFDGMEPVDKRTFLGDTSTTVAELLPKCFFEEGLHPVAPMDTEMTENTKNIEDPPASQGQDTSLAESNVQKIEKDLAVMVKTVAQLRSVLEQSQARSENHAQLLQQEFMDNKMLSQKAMSELMKDLNRLEARCTQLESEKLEIMHQFEESQRDFSQTTDTNAALKLENTELLYKYDKVCKEKADIEHNLNVLLKEKSVIENNLEMVQRERDKMDKKLQKYHARLKDNSYIDSELASGTREGKSQSEQRILDATGMNERKLKLQCLNHEFSINKFALEKALEKCNDHISMLNDVSKLVTLVTRQQFVVTEAQAAWQETDYYLRHTILQYQEDYLKLKILLESDEQIENLNDIKLPSLNIIFPQPSNLMDLYHKGKAKFIHHQMSPLPNPWAMHQDPRYWLNDTRCIPHGLGYLDNHSQRPGEGCILRRLLAMAEDTASDPRNTFFARLEIRCDGWVASIQNFYPTDETNDPSQRSRNDLIGDAGSQRERNTVHQGPTVIVDAKTSVETQGFDGRTLRKDLPLYYTGKGKQEVSPGTRCATAVGTNPLEGVSQIGADRRSSAMTKVGTDLLLQKLRKKFVGVPELDLVESVQDVRRLHNDTLSGMRVDEIIRESEPFVKQRQEKHMAYYSQSTQTLPPERLLAQPNKPSQRKLSSSTALGQRKKIQGAAREQGSKLGDYQYQAPAVVPAAMKKRAWGSVTSGLVEWIKNEEDSECTICFENMNVYDKRNPVYMLPCQHSFHTTCIKKWLGENSVCPICRIHCTMDDEFPPLPS